MTKFEVDDLPGFAGMIPDKQGEWLRLSDVQEVIAQRINAAQINNKPEVQAAMKELLDDVNSN